MKKTELNAFRKALETRQTELGHGNQNRSALAVEANADELDRTQNANDRDCAISNLERGSSRLREVRAALRRMDAGTFGICAGCEEDISPKRLAAVPWAPFCIVCQEAADREQTGSAIEALESSLVLSAA
jgi:DnaK suppressor protein